MITYQLKRNLLVPDESHYIARVKSSGAKTLDDVLKKMVEEGTGLTRPQALAYFEKMTQIVLSFLEDGCSVNTPLFIVRPTIKGIFPNYSDIFDPAKHKLSFTMRAGSRVEPNLKNIELSKLKSKLPFVDTFFDGFSQQTSTIATPGKNAEIKGDSLLFNPEDPKQGVFFIPVGIPDTEIRALSFLRVNAKDVSFMIPELEAGNYILKVKTGSDDDGMQCSGVLKVELTVS